MKVAHRMSGEAVRLATGAAREVWFRRLDAWGAADRTHREIAAWLTNEHAIDNWWAQTLTVDYEHARGLRPPGGTRDGTFAVNASATVAVPVEQLFTAFVDARQRRRWLPGGVMRPRTSQPGRSARFDWTADDTRVFVGFTAKGEAKSQVSLGHERLPSARAAQKAKAFWRDRLSALKALLNG